MLAGTGPRVTRKNVKPRMSTVGKKTDSGRRLWVKNKRKNNDN